MKHAFTIDLEDWFCSHNLQQVTPYKDWNKLESRVVKNTEQLMEILQRSKISATFFVLGWIADHFPCLVKSIKNEGHEIGSHGYSHQRLVELTPELFKLDIKESVRSITSAIGNPPTGYRAPAFSVVQKTLWALPILKNFGFEYDSSIYPTSFHPDYGMNDINLNIHNTQYNIMEIPMSCAEIGSIRIPCSGGAYFRFMPYFAFRFFAKLVEKKGRPLIFYIHPWELDSNPPKVHLPTFKKIRHYTNVKTTQEKLNRLLNEFEFTSLHEIINSRKILND